MIKYHIVKKTKLFVISILWLLLLFSCKKENVYLFKNTAYFDAFEDKKKNYLTIRKKLIRDFYQISDVNIDSFQSLPDEIKKIQALDQSGIFFCEDFLSPFFLKQISFNKGRSLKLFTYNIPVGSDKMLIEPELPVFNIQVDYQLIHHQLFSLLDKISKVQEYQDCLFIYDSDYEKCEQISNKIKTDNLEIKLIDLKTEPVSVETWLKQGDYNAIIFFGFSKNKLILEDKIDIKKYKIIEVLSNYGEINQNVHFRISINWNRAILIALNSKDYTNFMRQEKENKIYHFIVNNRSTVELKKYSPKIKKQITEKEDVQFKE